MKLAIPYDNGQVFQHFGKTEAFKIYDIVDGKVGPSMVMSTNGQGHGALAGLLRGLGISAVICGGIGPGAIEALQSLDITEALCNHHHHDDGHSCASHTCGSGGCHAH